MSIALALTASAVSAVPSAAQNSTATNVAQFLARVEKLMPLGPLALAAPDGQRLKAELIDTARRYKSRNDAQRTAGKPRTSCPPDSGDMSPEVWLRHLRSYPAAQRPRTSIAQAFDAYMVKNYPC